MSFTVAVLILLIAVCTLQTAVSVNLLVRITALERANGAFVDQLSRLGATARPGEVEPQVVRDLPVSAQAFGAMLRGRRAIVFLSGECASCMRAIAELDEISIEDPIVATTLIALKEPIQEGLLGSFEFLPNGPEVYADFDITSPPVVGYFRGDGRLTLEPYEDLNRFRLTIGSTRRGETHVYEV